MPSLKTGLQKLTDLCCCVNAFEGYFMAYPVKNQTKESDKVYFRQRKAMTDCVLSQAESLYKQGASLTQLKNAVAKGGWEDNYFICIDPIKPTLKISYKV